jgi:hypothetical protein
MIVLVLISVSLATSLHKNGISRGIRFWQWYDSFPLFLPLFFTAAGIALHQLGVPQQQQQPQRKLHPPVKAKNISPKQEKYAAYSGGESKNSSGETIVYADESKGGDGSADSGTNTSLQEEDAFAALDAMWQESEAGGITKTELLHAVIAEIEQTSAGEGVPASTSAEHLWRAARALSNLASWEPTLDPEEKKNYVVRGLDFAKRAEMQATKNSASLLCQANATKFLAILQGQSTAFLGTKEGMVLAEEIRKNMEKALKLNPLDPMLHYMLAVWKYNVAEVPYGIRYAASWVSGVLLEADFESALVDVEKALELGGSDFYIDIHVMYARLQMKIGGKGSKTLAVASLEKACSLKVVSPSDKQIKGKAERLLWKAKRE